MKPLIQKLPLNEAQSFVARTYRTPNFEVGWHQHVEYEIILFTEGAGLSFVGNHVGEFEKGDLYLLGSNLPHTFQKRDQASIASAVVVQFTDTFWGNPLIELPECRQLKALLSHSIFGLKITGKSRQQLNPLVQDLEWATDLTRLLMLLNTLNIIATRHEYIRVSTQPVKPFNGKDQTTIDRVFQYTIDHFKEPITVSRAASVACLTVPAFCSYFKRCTKKTYIDFLNEIRIGYASTLLTNTQKTIPDICYESGYQTLANFHKQFLKTKQFTPLQYRKFVCSKLPLPQHNIGIL